MSTSKQLVNNASSVGIIYRATNPRQVFLEIKDDGYPRKVFRRMGCLIGGNWVGVNAKQDRSPLDTFLREVEEELSFDKAIIDPVELRDLHAVDVLNFEGLRSPVTPSASDREALRRVRHAIMEHALPYFTHRISVPEKIFQSKEPDYSRGDSVGIISYFVVGLSDEDWSILEGLQKKFGNLSNESITVVTSLKEIIETRFRISWGHDRVLQQFFRDCGFDEAFRMPIVAGIRRESVGIPHDYEYYLQHFEFKVMP